MARDNKNAPCRKAEGGNAVCQLQEARRQGLPRGRLRLRGYLMSSRLFAQSRGKHRAARVARCAGFGSAHRAAGRALV